jgi:tetratricopeptide (TPR) repeat protein
MWRLLLFRRSPPLEDFATAAGPMVAHGDALYFFNTIRPEERWQLAVRPGRILDDGVWRARWRGGRLERPEPVETGTAPFTHLQEIRVHGSYLMYRGTRDRPFFRLHKLGSEGPVGKPAEVLLELFGLEGTGRSLGVWLPMRVGGRTELGWLARRSGGGELWISGGPATPATPPPRSTVTQAGSEVERVLDLHRLGFSREALPRLERLAAAGPSEALPALAQVLFDLGRYAEAVERCDRALADPSPVRKPVALLRAEALFRLRRWSDLVAACNSLSRDYVPAPEERARMRLWREAAQEQLDLQPAASGPLWTNRPREILRREGDEVEFGETTAEPEVYGVPVVLDRGSFQLTWEFRLGALPWGGRFSFGIESLDSALARAQGRGIPAGASRLEFVIEAARGTVDRPYAWAILAGGTGDLRAADQADVPWIWEARIPLAATLEYCDPLQQAWLEVRPAEDDGMPGRTISLSVRLPRSLGRGTYLWGCPLGDGWRVQSFPGSRRGSCFVRRALLEAATSGVHEPRSAPERFLRAGGAFGLGDWDGAIRDCEEVLRAEPGHAGATQLLEEARRRRGG